MISRLMAIAGWLAAGHALLFGLFWVLLSVPESNVAMLAASALTVLVMVFLFGWMETLGLLAWRVDTPARELPGRAFRAAPGVWLGAALFVAVWYLVMHAGVWWHGHQGEADAWLMLHLGWTRTGVVHEGVQWLLVFVRLVGLSLAVSLAATVAVSGYGAVGRAQWLRGGLSPRRLLIVAAILIVFVWLPLRGVGWRPSSVMPNWQETAFVAVKLGAIYALANIGWALVLGAAAKRR